MSGVPVNRGGARWSLRSWLVVAVVVAPVVVFREFTGFEYPSWVLWGCIAVAFVVGAALLVGPRALDFTPVAARAVGALVILAAAVNAYSQFTKSASE